MNVVAYQKTDDRLWDAFCANAHTSTFLHSRLFLAYHGERFDDRSLFIHDAKGQCVGLLPAAVDPTDSTRVISHPGITYGGILHGGELRGEAMYHALAAAWQYYRSRGFNAFRYKAVPHIYHCVPAQDDLYALFRLGARRYRCDLSCAIDLEHRGTLRNRRRRAMKKADKAELKFDGSESYLTAVWELIADNLRVRHDSKPTHSVQELRELLACFPSRIRIEVALQGDEVVAGLVLFCTPRVMHAQYIASNAQGNRVNALDALINRAIESAGQSGCRWFDFGISNEDDGRTLNDGLYDFKSGFGGGGVAHEFYELIEA